MRPGNYALRVTPFSSFAYAVTRKDITWSLTFLQKKFKLILLSYGTNLMKSKAPFFSSMWRMNCLLWDVIILKVNERRHMPPAYCKRRLIFEWTTVIRKFKVQRCTHHIYDLKWRPTFELCTIIAKFKDVRIYDSWIF